MAGPTHRNRAASVEGHRSGPHDGDAGAHVGAETIAKRVVDPVLVDAEEAQYERDSMLAVEWGSLGNDFAIRGDLPTQRAFYSRMQADDSGRIWVGRIGPAKKIEECTSLADMSEVDEPVPCWEPQLIIDVFNLDGEYLGKLTAEDLVPIGFGVSFISGETVVAGHQDELGTAKVRVYRLIIPDSSVTGHH